MPGCRTGVTELFGTQLDQASGLRRLFEKRSTAMIAFVSAQRVSSHPGDRLKLMMQFAADLSSVGKSVAIFDEHPAPGGIAQAYGVNSRKDFKHVLRGDYSLTDAMLSPAPGLSIIPASRAAGMEFSLADEASLDGNIALLRNKSDCIMVDCVHRTQRVLSPIADRADQLLVLVPANNQHLTQAYSLIKRIALSKKYPPIAVVMAHASSATQARAVFDKLKQVALEHLGVTLQYHGAAMTPGAGRLSIDQANVIWPSSLEAGPLPAVSARLGIADSVV